MLDVDALAAAEGRSWVYQGMQCLPPEERRLSRQPLRRRPRRQCRARVRPSHPRFVEGGFALPEGKQIVAWEDADTLLIARDWGPGTMTSSGYPFVIKRLRRGQRLDQAVEVYRGSADDVRAAPLVLRDSDGRVHGVGAYRGIDFFHRQFILFRPGGNLILNIPERASLAGIIDGRVLVTLDEAWQAAPDLRFAADSLVSYDLAEWERDPLGARPSLVWAPGPRQTLGGVATTRSRLILGILDNIRGRAFSFEFTDGGWRSTELRAAAIRDDLGDRRRRTGPTRRCSASPPI